MAAEVTIVVIPSDTEAGSFNIFQFVYNSNGDPQPVPFLLESNVPESSFISGYTVIVDDNAYGVRLISNDDRGFECVNTPIDHFFSNIQISNNFLISDGNLSITGVTFGSTSLSPLPNQNETVFISLNTGTTVQDTTTVGIYNNEVINTLLYQITIRDSDNILPFTYSNAILPASGAEISFTGTTLSPNRQFRISLNPFTPPSPTPSLSPTQTIPASPSVTPTIPASPSVTPSVTASPGLSPSVTPSLTPSRTATPTATPTISLSTSPGLSPSITPTLTPTRTLSKTITPSVTMSPSFTPSKTPTRTVTPTLSPPAVIITNTNGAQTISGVTINGVLVSNVTYPISAGNQVTGSTTQIGTYTVVVILGDVSNGEHIDVNVTCTATISQSFLSFSNINTTGGVTISYGAGIC